MKTNVAVKVTGKVAEKQVRPPAGRPVAGRPTLIKGGKDAKPKKTAVESPKWLSKIATARGKTGFWLVLQAGDGKSGAFRFHPQESWSAEVRLVDEDGNLMSPSGYFRVEADDDGIPTIDTKIIRDKDLTVEAELG